MQFKRSKFAESQIQRIRIRYGRIYRVIFVPLLIVLSVSCSSFKLLNYSLEEAETRVNTLVRILDPKKKPVEDLTINDFYVWEDRVPIKGASNLSLNDIDPQPDLYTIILFDNSLTGYLNFAAEKRSLLTFIDVQPTNMKIKIIALSPEARELTDFSNDKDLLRQAVNSLELANDTLDLYAALEKSADILHELPYGPASLPTGRDIDFSSTADWDVGTKRNYSSALVVITNGDNNSVNAAIPNGLINKLKDTHKFIISVAPNSSELDHRFFRSLIDATDRESAIVKSKYYKLKSMKNFFPVLQGVWERAARITQGYYILSYNSFAHTKTTHKIKLKLNQIKANKIKFTIDFIESPYLSIDPPDLGTEAPDLGVALPDLSIQDPDMSTEDPDMSIEDSDPELRVSDLRESSQPESYLEYLQIASFTQDENLNKTIEKLASLNQSFQVVQVEFGGTTYKRLIVGPITSEAAMFDLEEKLYDLAYYNFFKLDVALSEWIGSGVVVYSQ